MKDTLEVTEESTATAVATVPQRSVLLRPIAAPADILAAQESTRTLLQETLVDGRDYGLIPGIKKPSLLKPGAERVGIAFGCFPRYRIIEQEVDHDRKVEYRKKKRVYNNAFKGDNSYSEQEVTGESIGLYRYVVECEIVHRDTGNVVGACIGVCSTMEAKYIDRPRECENTALKMAEKRAHVGAVLNAFGLSDQFTQDVEDAGVATETPVPVSNGKKAANGGPPADGDGGFKLVDKVPFGDDKGKPLADLKSEQLAKLRDWCKSKGKFEDLAMSCDHELKRRGQSSGSKAVTDEDVEEDKRQKGIDFDNLPQSLEDTDDDLPF